MQKKELVLLPAIEEDGKWDIVDTVLQPDGSEEVVNTIERNVTFADAIVYLNRYVKARVTLTTILSNIEQWGRERNIICLNSKEQTVLQLTKTLEEVAETIEALVSPHAQESEILDGFGDILVTLVQAMACQNITAEAAAHSAYQEIRYRKGMLVNGKFVKEA